MNEENSSKTFSWHIFVGAEINEGYYEFCSLFDYFHMGGNRTPNIPPEIFTKDQIIDICNVNFPKALNVRITVFDPYDHMRSMEPISEIDELYNETEQIELEEKIKRERELLSEEEFMEFCEEFPLNQESESAELVCHFPQVCQVIKIHTKMETLNKIIDKIRDNIYFILKKSESGNLKSELFLLNSKIEKFMKKPSEPPCFSLESFGFLSKENRTGVSEQVTISDDLDDEIPF